MLLFDIFMKSFACNMSTFVFEYAGCENQTEILSNSLYQMFVNNALFAVFLTITECFD